MRRPTRAPGDEFQQYAAALTFARDLWDQHFPGHPVLGEVELVFTSSSFDRMSAAFDPDNPLRCKIEVPEGYRALHFSDLENQFIFAHELFHCFQYHWLGESWPPPWVIEGSAQWAAIDLFRSTPFPFEKWFGDDWFTAASAPLHARSYYAWPLYENARLSGIDAYDAIRKMFQSASSYTGQQLSNGGLDGEIFRKDWSTRTLRSPALDATWRLPWPTTDATAGPHENTLKTVRGVGTYHVNGAPSYAQLQWDVAMTGDVGLVVVTPDGGPLTTWTSIGTVTVGDGFSQRFCFDPSGCVCPGDGSSDSIAMDGVDMIFSYPANLQAVIATVVATPWDPASRCRDTPKGKDGASNGDPHLVTLDGLPYDVMTLGEFVLSRDPAGDFEVQTRHEAWGGAAGTTAIAIGTGTSRVTATMPDFAQAFDDVVRVDGAVTTETSFTVDGVVFSASPGMLEAVWPDGTTVTAEWFMGWFVLVHAPPERAARLEGLLGAGDDDLSNDLRYPDGTPTDTTGIEWDDSAFVLAWAVDDSTSLFDYGPGQSAATFRIPHPHPTPPPIDPAAAAECDSALGDAAAAHELSACAFDVSVTGETAFLDGYAEVVDVRVAHNDEPIVITDATGPTETTTPGSVATSQAGEPTLTLTVDGPLGTASVEAGTILLARARACPADVRLDLQVARSDAPDQLAVTALCDPTGVGGILASGDDEWVDGEAYVWLPGSGEYDVAVTSVGYDPGLDVQPVDVFTDPTPTVVTADEAVGGDDRTLSGVGDTVAYLTDPHAVFDATGFDQACAVAVYWTKTFPDPAPFALSSCEHSTAIDFPPSDTVIPTVVFTRTPDEVTIRLTPR